MATMILAYIFLTSQHFGNCRVMLQVSCGVVKYGNDPYSQTSKKLGLMFKSFRIWEVIHRSHILISTAIWHTQHSPTMSVVFSDNVPHFSSLCCYFSLPMTAGSYKNKAGKLKCPNKLRSVYSTPRQPLIGHASVVVLSLMCKEIWLEI